jgi:hypothetical protein
MFLNKKKDRQCGLFDCSNKLNESHATVRVGDEGDYTDIAVCDECERLLETLEAKSQELFDESL